MDEQKLDDSLEPIYNSSVPIQDVALKTCWEQWTIETGGERGSARSVVAGHDDDNDDDDDIYIYIYICVCVCVCVFKSVYFGSTLLIKHVLLKTIEHCVYYF